VAANSKLLALNELDIAITWSVLMQQLDTCRRTRPAAGGKEPAKS
jgi:hypothetical protein